jgi:hypothetical protein
MKKRTMGAIVLVLVIAFVACTQRRNKHMNEAREMIDLLGSDVLIGKPGLRVHIYRPAPHLAMYTAYARYHGGVDELARLASALRLAPKGTLEAGGHLPASWTLPSGASLSWWDATSETPEASAARPHGTSGWIVAKHEQGRIYVIVSDAKLDHP